MKCVRKEAIRDVEIMGNYRDGYHYVATEPSGLRLRYTREQFLREFRPVTATEDD